MSNQDEDMGVAAGATPELSNWEAHFGNDYTVVMLPGETTDAASITVYSDDPRIARLIAAAPDLLAALKFYANPEVYKAHPHGPAFDDRDLSFVARAAIAKATQP